MTKQPVPAPALSLVCGTTCRTQLQSPKRRPRLRTNPSPADLPFNAAPINPPTKPLRLYRNTGLWRIKTGPLCSHGRLLLGIRTPQLTAWEPSSGEAALPSPRGCLGRCSQAGKHEVERIRDESLKSEGFHPRRAEPSLSGQFCFSESSPSRSLDSPRGGRGWKPSLAGGPQPLRGRLGEAETRRGLGGKATRARL